MVKIVIENLGQKEIIVNDPSSTSVTEGKAHGPLLRLIQGAGIDWMTDCGGKGRCTTCKAIIIAGGEHLTGTTPAELKYRDMGALGPDERLTCQARLAPKHYGVGARSEGRVKGDVILRVPDEFKLRHITYT
jgi:ferredoxin, 2Fe-2S